MVLAACLFASPTVAFACTQIYVGSNLTDTGDTYVGRSEDYSTRYPKLFGVQESLENPTYTSDESDFSWTYEGTSYRYTYVRDAQEEWDEVRPYSEAGTNEMGVSVSATESTSMNASIRKIDPLSSTGIGEFNIPDVILGTCATAREGVELLGSLVDEYGSSECNQIIIADSSETWLFMQLSGHQWLAMVMPDDQVSVNPNMGNLQFTVDLDDETVCLHSEDLEAVAEEAGTYTAYDDGTMNVAASYGGTSTASSRYVQGHLYFGDTMVEGEDYTVSGNSITSIADLQLLFTPGDSSVPITLNSALRSLAARGEQSDSLAVNSNLNSSVTAIGSQRTTEAHIFQIRSELSSDIATIEWIALSPAEFNVYLPVYGALLTEVDETYYPNECDIDMSHAREGALAETDSQAMVYQFMDINTIANANRRRMAAGVSAYLSALQNSIIEQQETVDAVMQALPAGEARTELANSAFQQATEQLYEKSSVLLEEMRDYVEAEDTSEPFVPSDYDADTGSINTPLVYAAVAVAPVITAQPVSATYELGATATPLSVTATAGDSVDGTDSLLTYQWYVAEGTQTTDSGIDGFTAVEGATGTELAIDTTTVGTKTYAVVITNAAGLATVSEGAVITVNEPAVEPDEGNEGTTDSGTTGGSGTSGTTNTTGTTDTSQGTDTDTTTQASSDTTDAADQTGSLVQTSDVLNPAVLGIIAVVGVAAVCVGVFLLRRNRS